MYLRKLNELDSELIMEVIRECKNYYKDVEGVQGYRFTEEFIQEEADDFINPYVTDEEYTEELKIGVFEKNDREDKILGITQVLLDHKTQGRTTIGLTLIKESARGKGVGRWLHDILVKISQRKNQKKLALGVDIKNQSARKIWEHLGYEKTEEVKFKYKFKETRIIFLEKNI
ncbi:MAG: GNAT family N-acetyltransferase [Fusobacteriaceae bacterium]